jgi:hypothetical protein
MTVETHIAYDNDAREWDTIISNSPHGTLFHYWKWLKITEKHTQSTLYPLIGTKDGIIVGAFPLFFQKKGPLRIVFSPPPHVVLFYLGPILSDWNKLNQEKRELNYIEFQKSVDIFIKNELKPHYVSISLSPNLQDPRPFTWSKYSSELHFDYVVDLSRGCDYLFKALHKKERQKLNRARKIGITVEIGGKNEYERILDLMEIRYAQQGKNVSESRQYFLDIYDEYKDFIKVFIAKYKGEIVTGSIDLQYGDTHYSWIGNPKPRTNISPSPNDLLIWESILYAYQGGFQYYVTMNAAGNKRLHSYYASKFNPELKTHFSVKKNSFIIGILEKSYIDMIKPLKEITNLQYTEYK